jgi:hypothetical protein
MGPRFDGKPGEGVQERICQHPAKPGNPNPAKPRIVVPSPELSALGAKRASSYGGLPGAFRRRRREPRPSTMSTNRRGRFVQGTDAWAVRGAPASLIARNAGSYSSCVAAADHGAFPVVRLPRGATPANEVKPPTPAKPRIVGPSPELSAPGAQRASSYDGLPGAFRRRHREPRPSTMSAHRRGRFVKAPISGRCVVRRLR